MVSVAAAAVAAAAEAAAAAAALLLPLRCCCCDLTYAHVLISAISRLRTCVACPQATNALDTVLALPVRPRDVDALLALQAHRRLTGTSHRAGHAAFHAAHTQHTAAAGSKPAGGRSGSADGIAESSADGSADGSAESSGGKGCGGDGSRDGGRRAKWPRVAPGSPLPPATMPWRDALALLGGVGLAPGANKSHVALRLRQVDPGLAEKVAALKGKQKGRKQLHDAHRGAGAGLGSEAGAAMGGDGSAEAKAAFKRDHAFFLKMRSEGNLEDA